MALNWMGFQSCLEGLVGPMEVLYCSGGNVCLGMAAHFLLGEAHRLTMVGLLQPRLLYQDFTGR